MNDNILERIDSVLTLDEGSTASKKDEFPPALIGSDYVNENIRAGNSCPLFECNATSEWDRRGDEFNVVCENGHEKSVPVDDHIYYKLDFQSIMGLIATTVGETLDYTVDTNLPKYIKSRTSDGSNIYLVVSPANYERTVNEILIETIQEDTPALLVTPEENVNDLLGIASLFSSGNLIYTIPFTMLTEPEHVQKSLSTIHDIKNLENRIIDSMNKQHPVVKRVNSNPRYILTELNHMLLLRLNKEIDDYSGERLEKIAESALSHIFVTYPESGGEDDRGGNVPDNIFYVPSSDLTGDKSSIFGVVDAKSGKAANFDSEKTNRKHDEYLNRARRQSVPEDHIAHVFLVLDFSGQKEIEFYDEMGYGEDESMVIITAEALAMILIAYLSHTVVNELKLVKGNFQEIIYPFFNKKEFSETELTETVRGVGRKQEKYDHKYKKRPGLIIVTTDIVKERLNETISSPNDIERIFEAYFSEYPTI